MLWIILLLGLTLKFFPDAAHGQVITSPPAHFTGTIGGSASFSCEVEFTGVQDFFSWEFNNNPVYINQYDMEDYPLGEKKYSVKKESGIFTLIVKDLVHKDGGLYSCLVLRHTGTAVLLVLGMPHLYISPPSQMEGQAAEFICTTKIGGLMEDDISPKQYPRLQMFLNSESLHGLVQVQQLQDSTNITMIQNVTLEATMNGEELMCKIETFSPPAYINVTTKVKVLRLTEIPSPGSESDSWKIAVGITIPLLLIICAGVAAFSYYTKRRKNMYNSIPVKEDYCKVQKMMIDPNNDIDHKVVIALDHAVLEIPPKSVAELTRVSVKEKWNFKARQQQIQLQGLDNVLKPVVQLSLEPSGIKLSQPAMIKMTNEDMTKYDNLLVFSRTQSEDLWTDITADCGVVTKEDGVLFKINTFAELVILLFPSSRQDAPSLASTLLNNEKSTSSEEGMGMVSFQQPKHTTEEELSTKPVAEKSGNKQKNKYRSLVKTIERLKQWNDLDETKAKKMKELMHDQSDNPAGMQSALIHLLERAKILIQSDHYVDVCEEAAEEYIKIQKEMHEDPLLVLVQQLENDDRSSLIQYPEKLLRLIEVILRINGSNDTRSRCVRVLIINTKEWQLSQGKLNTEENKSGSVKQLQWSPDFIMVLKKLGEEGADPAWSLEGLYEGSNLHFVMIAFKHIMSHKTIEHFMHLMEVMLTKSSLGCDNVDYENKTILHTLVDGEKFPLFPDCAEQLAQLISRVKTRNSDLLDATNRLKHTPLHTFVISVLVVHTDITEGVFAEAAKQWKDKKEACQRVIKSLISPKNKDIQSKDGHTPLHDLAECALEWKHHPDAFLEVVTCLYSSHNIDLRSSTSTPLFLFVCGAKEWANNPETFLDVVRYLKSASNIDFQNDYGCTPLHQLTSAAAIWSNHADIFLLVVECLKSNTNIDMLNESKDTPLSNIASAAGEWSNYSKVFIEVIKCLKSPANIDSQNGNGDTPLHLVTATVGQWKHNQSALLEVVKFLRTDRNVNLGNNSKNTPLIKFVKASIEWTDHTNAFNEVFNLLKSPFNIDITNVNGNTPLHQLTSAAAEWVEKDYTFLEFVSGLISKGNINVQNNIMNTPLHHVTSVASKWKDHPKQFLKVVKSLQNTNNVNLKTKVGNTALHHMTSAAGEWKDHPGIFLIVIKLLKSLSNIDIQDENRNTPLHLVTAAASKWKEHKDELFEVIKSLKSSSNVNSVNEDQQTPLHIITTDAAQWKNHPVVFLEIVRCLLSSTNIALQTTDGNTPLHYVTHVASDWVGHPDVLLNVVNCLKCPSNIKIQNNLGCTPLHNVVCDPGIWAEKSEMFLKIVECLISPTNVHLESNQGHTALYAFNEDIKNLKKKPKYFTKVAECLKSGKVGQISMIKNLIK